VRQGLLRGAVQQDRDVDPDEVLVVAVCPLDDDHLGAGDVHLLVPEGVGGTSHPLQEQRARAGMEGSEDAVDLVEVHLVRGAEIAGERGPPGPLVGRQPRMGGHLPGVGIGVGGLQRREPGADGVVVGVSGHQSLDAPDAEGAQPLGVIGDGDAARVVVAGEDVRADTEGVEPVGQQRAGLGLADPGAAVDGDHCAVLGARLKHRSKQPPQLGEDAARRGQVARRDLHLVAGHVPGGDSLEVGWFREAHVHGSPSVLTPASGISAA